MDTETIALAKADLLAALRRSAHALGMDVVRTGQDAEAAANDIGAAVRRSTHMLADDMRADVRRAKRTAAELWEDHPLAILGASAAVGLLIGLAISRR